MDPDGNRLQNSCSPADTGGTQPCIECPQCLGLQLLCAGMHACILCEVCCLATYNLEDP